MVLPNPTPTMVTMVESGPWVGLREVIVSEVPEEPDEPDEPDEPEEPEEDPEPDPELLLQLNERKAIVIADISAVAIVLVVNTVLGLFHQ